jgi:hypothetical protein
MKGKNLMKEITESAVKKSNNEFDVEVEQISTESAEKLEGGDRDFGCTPNSVCGIGTTNIGCGHAHI